MMDRVEDLAGEMAGRDRRPADGHDPGSKKDRGPPLGPEVAAPGDAWIPKPEDFGLPGEAAGVATPPRWSSGDEDKVPRLTEIAPDLVRSFMEPAYALERRDEPPALSVAERLSMRAGRAHVMRTATRLVQRHEA